MTARKFAADNGFPVVHALGQWRGYQCHEALLREPESVDDVPLIGLPQIILEKDGEFRFADLDEAMDYIREHPEEDESEE